MAGTVRSRGTLCVIALFLLAFGAFLAREVLELQALERCHFLGGGGCFDGAQSFQAVLVAAGTAATCLVTAAAISSFLATRRGALAPVGLLCATTGLTLGLIVLLLITASTE